MWKSSFNLQGFPVFSFRALSCLWNPRFVFAVLLLTATGSAVARQPAQSVEGGQSLEPRLTLRDVRDDESGTTIRRGTFRVWENRQRRSGRVLELEVVVLPALGKDARRDPIFCFSGGPGQNAAARHAEWADHWMRQQRDIVLVSQRGTGGNNRLTVELSGGDDDLQGYLEPAFQEKPFRTALETLRKRFDLSQYSTFAAADDVNDLRIALGYGKINLYGGSYGSRAELIYLRCHSETVRTVIINSIAPIAFKNPLHHARSAQDTLDRILDECAADPQCREAFGDVRAKFKTVLERLDREPARATVRPLTTGKKERVKVSRAAFGEALRVAMYYDSRDVPLMIHRAHAGDFDDFAQRAIAANRALRESLAYGMLACVTCGEDVARIEPGSVAAETADTFLGDMRVRQQMAICEFWPKSDVPADFGAPVRSDVPVLILSGTLDPVTPPRFGEEALKHLGNGLHVVVPGSHGVGGPCVESLMREFLDRGTAAGLDTSCVRQMRLPPFNLGQPAPAP